jgi:hypothetical protein
MLDNVVVISIIISMYMKLISLYRRTILTIQINIIFSKMLPVYFTNIDRQRNKQAQNNWRETDLDDIR